MLDPEHVHQSRGKRMGNIILRLGCSVVLLVLVVIAALVLLGPEMATRFETFSNAPTDKAAATSEAASCKEPPTMMADQALQQAAQYYKQQASSSYGSMIVDKVGHLQVVSVGFSCDLDLCITYHTYDPPAATLEQQADFEFVLSNFLNGGDPYTGTPGPWKIAAMIPSC